MPLFEPHIDGLSAGTQSIGYGTAIFSNSNGVSFGMNNSTITASVGGAAPGSISAGLTNVALGEVVFSNSNGISFGLNGSTVTGTVATNYQSQGAYLTTAMLSNRGSDFVQATAGFNGTNASGTIASNAISISVNAQSVVPQNASLFALGNTTQNSSTQLSVNALSFNAIGSITMGYSNGSIQVSAPNALTTAMASNRGSDFVQAAAVFNGTNATGTIASNAISVSVAAQSNQNLSLFALGNTTQNSSTVLNANNLSFNGLGIVTMGYSNGSIQVSASQSVAPQNISLFGLGNTTQNSSTVLSANSISFNAIGSLTVGFSNGSIQLSAPNALTTAMASNRGSDFVQAAAVFNGTNATGTIASGAISVSVLAQSNQNISLFALGNTTQNSSTVLNANALSFNAIGSITAGFSNGSIQLSAANALTTAMASNRGSDFVQAAAVFNGTNASGTIASGAISVSVLSQSNQTVGLYAIGNTTQNSSTTLDARTLSFNGLGIITAGFSNGSIQISATQSNQNISLYALGNTTQNSSTVLNASAMSFNGLGIATVGYSNGSIQVSVPAGAPSPVNFSAGTTSGNLGSVVFANSNRVSFGLNGSTITAQHALNFSGGTTSQNISDQLVFSDSNLMSFGLNGSTITANKAINFSGGTTSSNISSQIIFSNSNGISFGMNSNTMTASVAQMELLHWDNMISNAGFTATANVASKGTVQGTVHVFPLGALPGSIAPKSMMFQMSHSATGNSSSGPKVFSISFGLYTRNVSTLSLLNSASTAISLAANIANSTGYSGLRWISVHSSAFSVAPFTISSGVEYFGAMAYSSGGNNSLAQTAGFIGFYPFLTAAMSGIFGVSQVTGSTQGFHPWLGVHGTVNVIPASINIADITKQGASANFIPYIAFNNLTSLY